MREMIRRIMAILIVFVFLFAGIAGATTYNWGDGDLFENLKAVFSTGSNGHNHDGTNSRTLGTSTTNPTFATSIVAAGFKAGVTTNVSTESSLTSAALGYGVISMVAGAGKTIGLADGVPGQMVTIKLTTRDGADVVISQTAFPVTTHIYGYDTITFDTQGDFCTLLWLDATNGWVVVYNSGCTLA